MASVRLGKYELEEYDLPKICMRCGAPATVYKRNKFRYRPLWAWFLLGWILADLVSSEMSVTVPLCNKHKWHWTGRAALVGFSLPLVPIFFLAGAFVASQYNASALWVVVPTGVLFLAWVVMAVVLLKVTIIRATEITDNSITLTAVSEEFIEALNADRRGEKNRGERPPRENLRPEGHDDDGGYYDPERRRRVREPDEDEP